MDKNIDNDEKIKIWFVREGEPLPIENDNRLYRTGQMAEYFSQHGYKVTWFSSTFLHQKKTYYFNEDKEINVSENEKLVLFHSPISYKKNMSPMRVLYHDNLAKKLKHYIMDNKDLPVPDIIFASYPTQQFCSVMIEYAKKLNVPVIVDARDQWPDIFERAFPKSLRGVGNYLLKPMKRRAAEVFKNATAVCAMSPVMLNWGLNYAKRKSTELDRVIFIATKREELQDDVKRKALDEWEKIGIDDKTWNVCLFSTLSKTSLDMYTLIDAIKKVHETRPEIRLIVGGTGDDYENICNYSKNLDYVHIMGWLNKVQMTSLMGICKVGMFPYRNTKDIRDGWGNKVGQYFSFGLPLLTSAEGFSKTYVERHECGLAYKENDSQNLADVIINLIENTDIQLQMSQCAYERFKLDFDYPAVMQQFVNMINDIQNSFTG